MAGDLHPFHDKEMQGEEGDLYIPKCSLRNLFAVKTILSCSVCRAVLNTESAISHVRLPSRKNDPDQISNLKINTNQI